MLLLDEHHALDAMAAEIETAILQGEARLHDIFAGLAALSGGLADRLLGAEATLCLNSPESNPDARENEIESLRWDWAEYLSCWPEQPEAVDWDLFAEHSLAILGRMRRLAGRRAGRPFTQVVTAGK